MDANVADVLKTTIQIVATLLAGAGGFVAGLIAERRRRQWEERHRFTEAKRVAYGEFLDAMDNVKAAYERVTGSKDHAGLARVLAAFGQLERRVNVLILIAPQPVVGATHRAVQAYKAATASLKDTGMLSAEASETMAVAFNDLVIPMRIDVGTSPS